MVVFLKNVYQLQCLHCLKVANNYTLKNITQFCLITVTVKVYFGDQPTHAGRESVDCWPTNS